MKKAMSSLLLLLCYSGSHSMQYPQSESPTIPVQGFRSILRFFTREQLEQIAQKADYMSHFFTLYEDDLTGSINTYNFLQLPVDRPTLELLPRLAEIDSHDKETLSKFLRKNSFSIVEIARATMIIAYHCYYKTFDSLAVTPKRKADDHSGALFWEPSGARPGLGWITIRLVNDHLTIFPHDGNFKYNINCSNGTMDSCSKWED